MSAICGNAGFSDELKRRLAEGDPVNLPWPFNLAWSDQNMSMEATVAGSWTGSYSQEGFSLTTIQYPGPSTSFIFSFADASPNTSKIAVVYDSEGNPYNLLLEMQQY